MIDDEDVLIYILNEIMEAEQMTSVFKVMMEHEDYPYDWLLEQFMAILSRLDEYALSERAEVFLEAVQKLNFRKMDSYTGETAELDDEYTESSDDSLDEFNPWER